MNSNYKKVERVFQGEYRSKATVLQVWKEWLLFMRSRVHQNNLHLAEMTEWLDHSTLVQRVPGLNHLQIFHIKCEESIYQLSVIPGKKDSQGVVKWRGRTKVALLDQSTYSLGPLCFAHKPISYEDRILDGQVP